MNLSDLAIFDSCSRRQARAADQLATPVDVGAGQTIYSQGRRGRDLMFVASGTFDVERDGEIIATITEDGVFGELAVLAGAPARRTASVRARTDGTVFVMSRLEFESLCDRVPRVGGRVHRIGVRRGLELARRPQGGPA